MEVYSSSTKTDKKIEVKSLFKCVYCSEQFKLKDELNKHRLSKHKTFKPCEKFSQGHCQFGERCFYNHIKLSHGEFICYVCGKTFESKRDLMLHRRNTHQTEVCREFLSNKCKFTSASCWWSHQINDKKAEQATQVFQESSENLAPPAGFSHEISNLMKIIQNMKMQMSQITQVMKDIGYII